MAYNKSYTVDEATRLLEQYCAYQERSHREVEQKLKSLKMIPEAREKIVLHLMHANFLNEERYAKACVRGKFSIKKWGRRKIVNELKFKGVSDYNIKTGLTEIDQDDYLRTLEEIALNKAPTIKATNDFQKKQKLQTYLIQRGFEPELVYQVTNKDKNN